MPANTSISIADEIFAHGGKMGELMRQFDWSSTSIGPVETWSPTLRTITRFLLANRFPLLLWWGPEFCQLYNDAYISVPGDKHPRLSLGQPGSKCWSEIWHIIGPLVRTPFEGGPSTWMEDLPLDVNRFGFLEETHFTVAYSPVPDDTAAGGIGGVLATVHEITGKIVGERRLTALRDLGARPTEGRTAEEACVEVAAVLEAHRQDIPFALLYLRNTTATEAHLAGKAGVDGDCAPLCPPTINLRDGSGTPWPLNDCIEQNVVLVERLQDRFDSVPAGPWSDPPDSAAVVPIKSSVAHHLAGYLVAGISPRLRFDDSYRGFLELAAAQIATAIANARAYEEERKRAEALADLDQAKTVFFTNISHEFRTPLTLMLSPLEQVIAKAETTRIFGNEERVQLDLARRNAMRLVKLVNTLLDFSRIEARRTSAVFQPTDVAQLTAELASVFRSATEKAGLTLNIECPPLSETVSVDREMWEKIVLNLLSNAFKFTLEGGITVRVVEEEETVRLEVADTGIGIPESELPQIFQRFHRVKGTGGRSFEGTGIGLALVQELVKMLGGTIRVQSKYGGGTTFTVTIPRRITPASSKEPQPEWSTATARFRAENYVEEALRWLPNSPTPTVAEPAARENSPAADRRVRSRVLLADDNADMREYLRRMLAQYFEVRTVSNGAQALSVALADPPDLVLSDVMMPELDGFELLRALRNDPRTQSLPIILLSARAGEEVRLEGLDLGADDYLVKPFTAQELLARVRSQLKLTKLRREAAEAGRVERERFLFATKAAAIGYWFCNLPFDKLIWDARVKEHFWLPPDAEVNIDLFYARLHPQDRERVRQAIDQSIAGNAIYDVEYRTISPEGEEKWIRAVGRSAYDENGRAVRFDGITQDITLQKRTEGALRRAEKLALVGRMASSISHEINNPLESVTNLLYLIEGTSTDQQSRAYTKTALEELARVSHIVTRTLQFNRPRGGPSRVNICELLDSAVAIYQGRLKHSGIVLCKDYGGEVYAECLSPEIRQVFANLIGNAFDATRPGGKIILRVREASDWKTGRKAVRVTIADTGHGMDNETRIRLFEPFFTTKSSSGTGLGLWISAEILNRHEGRFGVKSRRGCGTVFSMLFPLSFIGEASAESKAGIRQV